MNNGILGWSGQGSPVDLDVNTQLFTSSGTWTKPANCEWVRVIVVGGGGGGGGGGKRQQVGSATERPSGGGGGGGGGASFIDIPAGLLPNQVTVTVGAGGTAGVGGTADNALGTAGGPGGTTSFGNIITATGGGQGNQGQGGGFGVVAGGNGHILGGSSAYQFFGNPTTSTRGGGVTSGGGQGAAENDSRVDNRPLGGFTGTSPFFEPQKYGIISIAGMGGDFGFTTSAEAGTAGTFGSGGGGGGPVRTGLDNNGNTINGANGGVGGAGYCLVSAYSTMSKPVNVQVFKSNGQWNKPTDPRLSTARVFAIGGGGGGGSGRQWASNLGAACSGSYLALSGTSGNYASTPNSAALQITGDIDLQVKVSFWNWNLGVVGTTQTDRMVLSKWTDSGTNRSYGLVVNATGSLYLWWSADGSVALTAVATQNLNYTQNTIKWLRATMDVDNGASQRVVKFYTSDDGSAWTQFGTTITTAGVTSIFSNATDLTVGGGTSGTQRYMDGRVYRAIVKNGYDGAGSVVFDANFETQTAGTTSFTESSSNAATVTVTATATPTRTGGSGGSGGGISYSEIPLAFLPSTVDVTVGTGGTGGAAATATYSNGLNGTNGGRSSFGTYLSANGGERGYGGAFAAGPNTISASIYGASGGLALGGTNGAGSGAANASNSVATNTFTSGGGGGAGLATAGTTYTGGSSVVPTGYGSILSTVTAGLSGSNAFNGEGMFGSTGGGGGSSSGTPTRDGGTGGRGSGGGGGAASNNGTTSGAGGNGGDGYVIVVCV